MQKHWWQSMTIKGAIVAGLAVLASPDVFALLPHNVAVAVTVAGTVASAIGLRRAIPDPTP